MTVTFRHVGAEVYVGAHRRAPLTSRAGRAASRAWSRTVLRLAGVTAGGAR